MMTTSTSTSTDQELLTAARTATGRERDRAWRAVVRRVEKGVFRRAGEAYADFDDRRQIVLEKLFRRLGDDGWTSPVDLARWAERTALDVSRTQRADRHRRGMGDAPGAKITNTAAISAFDVEVFGTDGAVAQANREAAATAAQKTGRNTTRTNHGRADVLWEAALGAGLQGSVVSEITEAAEAAASGDYATCVLTEALIAVAGHPVRAWAKLTDAEVREERSHHDGEEGAEPCDVVELRHEYDEVAARLGLTRDEVRTAIQAWTRRQETAKSELPRARARVVAERSDAARRGRNRVSTLVWRDRMWTSAAGELPAKPTHLGLSKLPRDVAARLVPELAVRDGFLWRAEDDGRLTTPLVLFYAVVRTHGRHRDLSACTRTDRDPITIRAAA